MNGPIVTLVIEIDLTSPRYHHRVDVYNDLWNQARGGSTGADVRVRLGAAALDAAAYGLAEEIAKQFHDAALLGIHVPGGRREAPDLVREIQRHLHHMNRLDGPTGTG